MKSKDILKDIIDLIILKEIPKDSKFPPESYLAEKYQCNRHTIRKVIEILIERGYLRKVHGGPTFVNEIPSTYSLNLSSLYDINLAKKISTSVLNFSQVYASSEIAEKLKIKEGNKIWFITRLRFVDTVPDHIEYIYMPVSLFPNLTKKICKASLLSYIEYDMNFEISHGVKNISAIQLNNYEKSLLERNEDSLAIQIENIGFLTNERIYEYSINKHFNNSILYYAKR